MLARSWDFTVSSEFGKILFSSPDLSNLMQENCVYSMDSITLILLK